MSSFPIAAPLPLPPVTGSRPLDPAHAPKEIEQTARDFEAAFLAEALGHMGLDAAQGVEGAAPFASFVNRAYAEQLVEQGGLGLAENIVHALADRSDPA